MLLQVSPPNAVVLTARAQAWHAFQQSCEGLHGVFNIAWQKARYARNATSAFWNRQCRSDSFWPCFASMIFNVFRKIQLNIFSHLLGSLLCLLLCCAIADMREAFLDQPWANMDSAILLLSSPVPPSFHVSLLCAGVFLDVVLFCPRVWFYQHD